jgi:uncharacterized glyoxalase superfamily protein PhnB
MLANRSVPPCTVTHVLSYPDVVAEADWLCNAFGFTVRLRIGDHRVQLKSGDGCIVVAEGKIPAGTAHLVMVRVPDVDSHRDRAIKHGAQVLTPPTDHPFGERQYTAQDFAGHRWTFTQFIADVDPKSWGGAPVTLE